MDTNQIYSVVNDAIAQAIGEDSISSLDTKNLVSYGTTILSSSSATECFLNVLAMRIGRTIYRFRAYNNKFKDMVISDMQWGAILQKLRVEMPEAEEDPTFALTDGESVDQWKVSKPKAHQKLFVSRTPYMFKITIQKYTLKEAFTSPEAMASFIALVFGEVRNAIELSLESLGRLTLSVAMSETSDINLQRIHLVTEYNTEYELEGDDALTATSALRSESFLRFAIRRMNEIIDNIQDMSVMFCDGELPTFTNREDMRIRILSGFQRRLETCVEYASFHEQFTSIDGSYSTVNYWQSEQTPSSIDILVRPSQGDRVQISNIIAEINDRDAFGIYQFDEEVNTTGINAAARYYNQFWHELQNRYVDTSENMVIFILD
jgi:hypothetical protein